MFLEGGLAKEENAVTLNFLHSSSSPLLKQMRKDEVFSIVKDDQLIMTYGEVLHKRLGSARSKDICQRMRQLARLKLAVSGSGRCKQLLDLISGSFFDSLLKATQKLCGFSQSESGQSSFDIPSLALRLGQLLVKCAYLKRGMAVRQDKEKMKKEAEAFVHLHKSEWTTSVSAVALASMKRKKTKKEKHEIPLMSDLLKLQNYLVENINLKIKILEDEQSYQNWRSLAELTLTRTTMFNKIRANEVAKMLVEDYNQRPKWQEMACEEIAASFTETEKSLLKRLDMVQLEGKSDSPVSLVLTDDVKTALEVLLTKRFACGVHKSNPYFFASQSATGFIDTWQVLQKVAAEAGCVERSRITAARMRKYAATVFQIMSLKEAELEWLLHHLGHEVDTQRTYYRLNKSSVELAKISRLLMTLDMGEVAKYKGKTLDDIVISELEDDVEESVTDAHKSDEDAEIQVMDDSDKIDDELVKISNTNSECLDSSEEEEEETVIKMDDICKGSVRVRKPETNSNTGINETDVDEVHSRKKKRGKV